jgi:quinol monooxygenase YgiN
MLIVTGEVVVEAGAVNKIREALQEMERATRAEPGCLAYAFSVDINEPTMMRIFEKWESLEALRAHFATPHMATFGKAVAVVEPKSLDVHVFEIAGEVPLPR